MSIVTAIEHWLPPALPCVSERLPSIRLALLEEAVRGIVLAGRATRLSVVNATLAAHGEPPTSFTELEKIAAMIPRPIPPSIPTQPLPTGPYVPPVRK